MNDRCLTGMAEALVLGDTKTQWTSDYLSNECFKYAGRKAFKIKCAFNLSNVKH